MVLETEIVPFWQWLLTGTEGQLGTLPWFLSVAAAFALLALVAGYLLAAVRHGPLRAGDTTYRVVMTGLRELCVLSPRRVAALTWLAVRESFRRQALIGLLVFLLILVFAGWFLGTRGPDPARLYISFVLTSTTYLVLLLALFLSAFSLPTDIRDRTIYTIVTKPVRAGEVVLGRILGIAAVGTVMLAVMGACSFLFVVRSLDHTHTVDLASLKESVNAPVDGSRHGFTSRTAGHRHAVEIDASGNGQALPNRGHWHAIHARAGNGLQRYEVGPPEGLFRARIPIYGKLRFNDRTGANVARGISVGNEWTYRSYIEGGSAAAAIWTFNGIDPSRFPDGLPIDLMVSVFRTYKGDIEQGILGGMVVRNPAAPKKKVSDLIPFRAKEFTINRLDIPRDLTDSQGKPLDLFRDLVDQGRVEIQVQCLDPEQYFGMAQADCYLRAADGSFAWNFIKGFLGIWVQMIVVTAIGVMCGTFLSGSVAMMLTLGIVVVGFFKYFLLGVATGTVVGGGPVESLVRLVTQQNVTSSLDKGMATGLIQGTDTILLFLMRSFALVLPDFRSFSTVGFVADGYNIPSTLVAEDLITALVYLASMFVIGYFFFRTREVAR